MVKLSIVVPIFNSEKFLANCIESIVNQDFKDFELILVNDGSYDNSLEICKKYKSIYKNIMVIDKINEGVSKARNIGIKYSNGEYLMFIDSDDFIDKDMLKSLYASIESNDSDLCICNYVEEVNGKSKIIEADIDCEVLSREYISDKLIIPLIEREDNENKHNLAGFRSPWGKIYRKKIIIDYNLKFDENLSIGEDFIFNLYYLSLCNKICLNKGHYYHYVNNDNSALSKYKKDCWNSYYKKIIIKLNQFLVMNNIYDKAESRIEKLIIKYYILSLYNEKKNNFNLTFKEKLHSIKKICNDELVLNAIKKVNRNNYKVKEKIILMLSRYKQYILICILINLNNTSNICIRKG